MWQRQIQTEKMEPDKTALNSEDVVNAMNAAIDTYNSDATTKVTYQWKVGTILPELELVSE